MKATVFDSEYVDLATSARNNMICVDISKHGVKEAGIPSYEPVPNKIVQHISQAEPMLYTIGARC